MAIPSVMQGLIELEGGAVFELDSPKGVAWLEAIGSFRFEPSGDSKAYTVRREPSGYWYGCRKVAGKVRKKYIGKTSEISTAKLEEVAEALEVLPVPRVDKVAEVAQEVVQNAQVAERVAQDRLTALESEVANLRKAFEALQEALPGKFEPGDFEELPTVADNEVAEQLQNELSNLKAEREELAQLKKEVKAAAAELHREENCMKLEKVRWQRELSDTRGELADAKATMLKQSDKIRELERGYSLKPNPAESRLRLEIGELQAHLSDREKTIVAQRGKIKDLERGYGFDETPTEKILRRQIRDLEQQLSDLKQNSAPASKDLPEAADLLNRLKAKRKKSSVTLADVETLLELLEG